VGDGTHIGASVDVLDNPDIVSIPRYNIWCQLGEPGLSIEIDAEPDDGDEDFCPRPADKGAGEGVAEGHEAAEAVPEFGKIEGVVIADIAVDADIVVDAGPCNSDGGHGLGEGLKGRNQKNEKRKKKIILSSSNVRSSRVQVGGGKVPPTFYSGFASICSSGPCHMNA